MPRNPWEIEINSETPREDLEWCAIAAERTSDINTQKAAAKAKAELWRREQQAWTERFDAESRERVHAQRFQEAQITRQIEAQETLVGQQLEVASQQAISARRAMWAAWAAAVATVAIVIVSIVSLLQT